MNPVFVYAMVSHIDLSLGAVPRTTATTNWMINVSDIKTVKVSNISPEASERDIEEFFSFSGDIQYVEMRRLKFSSRLCYLQGVARSGYSNAVDSTIIDFSINITPEEDYELPPKAIQSNMEKKPVVMDSNTKKAEEMMSTMLARGFILVKDAINKAKAFDERHHLVLNASAAVTSIDQKMREMDELYQVSELTKSTLAVTEHKVNSAGSVIMSNHYVSAGASWLSNAFYAVARAAEDVGTLTNEKVEKAEKEINDSIYREIARIINEFALLHLNETSLVYVDDVEILMFLVPVQGKALMILAAQYQTDGSQIYNAWGLCSGGRRKSYLGLFQVDLRLIIGGKLSEFLRVRVEIDITKPLRCVLVDNGKNGKPLFELEKKKVSD
ncbi:putative esterase [Hibiscus syriacus]|uniref:Esterase n=1 Tax=Hibiscus syriacus TaxID=106335 RepID=A0A6A2XY83_HIBSY|nr:putative esterase [Hibiscus syriacus]